LRLPALRRSLGALLLVAVAAGGCGSMGDGTLSGVGLRGVVLDPAAPAAPAAPAGLPGEIRASEQVYPGGPGSDALLGSLLVAATPSSETARLPAWTRGAHLSLKRTRYLDLRLEPYVSASGELLGIEDGFGGSLAFGFVLNSGHPTREISLEGSVGLSFHDDTIAGQGALLLSGTAGAKFLFLSDRPVRPYLSAGLGLYGIYFESNLPQVSGDVNGAGGYVGAGVDFFFTPKASAGIDVSCHLWHGSDDNVPERADFVLNVRAAATITLYF